MSVSYIIKFFKRYFKSEKKIFIIAFSCALVSALIGIIYGYLMGLAIDKVAQSSFYMAVLILLFNLILGFLDNTFISRKANILMEIMANNMMEKISYLLYVKVGLLPARAFEEKSSGELMNRITNDSYALSSALKKLIKISLSLFASLLIFIYILSNSLLIALEIIVYIGLFYVFSKKYLPEITEEEQNLRHEKDKLVAKVNEDIHGVREIRALGIRESINNVVKNSLRNVYYKTNKQTKAEITYYAWVHNINILLEAVVFGSTIILLYFGKCSFAFFMALTFYIYRFMGTVDNLTDFTIAYEKMKVSIKRITEILDNKLYNDDEFGEVDKTDIEGNIEFKNVSFRYSDKEDYIFKNFNLKIPCKQKIAIVGKSGQGKSSIFNLLLRYFEPNSGVILIDDIPIYDFTEDALRQNIAIIRQEPFIFNRSILENFKMINPYVSLNKVRKVCKQARIDEYIMSLPDKYDTVIGEGGINLSGGQKQRLAIARALLKNSNIILMDEATSALDNVNQEMIKETLNELAEDHTVVMVAHRLSTIVDADIIFVIDKGSVVASGKHKELLKKCDIYKELYNNEM